MFRLAALNAEKGEAVGEENEIGVKGTKEAQEVQAFNLYNEALYLQQNNLKDEAVKAYEQLLNTTLISESVSRLEDKQKSVQCPLKDPGLILKYSTHKNVANICASKGDINTAMLHYLQAVTLDTSDVTLWYKIGTLAAKLSNLHLSRHAFTQGLECNPSHWPCLDNLITVLYAILDYEHCLLWISKAFDQDSLFHKGIFFRNKIISECPHLRKDTEHLFRRCDVSIFETRIGEEEGDEYLTEAMTLRKRKQDLCVRPPNPVDQLTLPLESFSWKSLGKSLLATYEHVKDCEEPISVTSMIDLDKIINNDKNQKLITTKCAGESVISTPSCSTTAVDENIVKEEIKHPADPENINITLEPETVSEAEMETNPPSATPETAPDDSTCSRTPIAALSGWSDTDVFSAANSFDGTNSQKKSAKRKRILSEKMNEQDQQNKRRSSRMRKPTQRSETENDSRPAQNDFESDFRESLLQYLPKIFHPKVAEEQMIEEDSRSQDSSQIIQEEPEVAVSQPPVVIVDETEEVSEFISSHLTNSGILHMLFQYCMYLGKRGHIKWEAGTSKLFIDAFDISYPTVRIEFSDPELLKEIKKKFVLCILTYFECSLDHKFKKYSGHLDYSPRKQEHECMGYLTSASFRPDYFEGEASTLNTFENFVIRYHWLRVLFFYLMGEKHSAMNELKTCSDLCSCKGTEKDVKNEQFAQIFLPNLGNYKEITYSTINLRLESLNRLQTLREVKELFSQNKYSEVIKLIKPSLLSKSDENQNSVRMNPQDTSESEWPVIYQYFLQSVIKVESPSDVLMLVGTVLSEAMHSFSEFEKNLRKMKECKGNMNSKRLGQWFSLIFACCISLDPLFELDCNVLSAMEEEGMKKLTQSLLSVIHISMTHLQLQTNFSLKILTSVGNFTKSGSFLLYLPLPWKLLHKTLKVAEEKHDKNEDSQEKEELPGSLKLLLTAHDWLGERGVCCVDGGKFLRFLTKNISSFFNEKKVVTVRTKETEMAVDVEETSDCKRSISPFSDSEPILKSEIEQCFYCLFGYPNKIVKSSQLLDHNSTPVDMGWDDAIETYKYFRPNILPGFDSYKAHTMLSELASLLNRIVKLVPERVTTTLQSYLLIVNKTVKENHNEELNIPNEFIEKDLIVIKDLYYLLADYNFKNKEMKQAVKFYLHDLCINPKRFDSWAGLALAKSSQVDERLRFCVTKKYKKESNDVVELANAALLCFERGMSLDKTSATLWIEYGSVAYWMHSYYSRNLRMLENKLTEEGVGLKQRKEKILELSQRCFQSALNCDVEDVNNEEWLIQYMLGKISEKKQATPSEFLQRYKVSAQMLHRKHAKYPKKIQFKVYQNDYAIEALELHFRLHTSILKLVQREVNILDGYEDDAETQVGEMLLEENYILFKELLDEASDSHFIRREVLPYSVMEEKQVEGKGGKFAAGKLETQDAHTSPLKMGSLIPDSVASALASHLQSEYQRAPEGKSQESNYSEASLDSEVSRARVQSCDEHPSEDMSAVKKEKELVERQPFTNEKRKKVAMFVIQQCMSGLNVCLRRFPQHYKSLYRLAHLYSHCSEERQHLDWARDILLNSDKLWHNLPHMPAQGLLAERNKTNIFNGVWKIPVDEIDRPGSFGSHLYRCILLLQDILLKLKDHNLLLYLHNMLSRNPDQGKKYLRDTDRISASRRALAYSLKALQAKIVSAHPRYSQMDTNTLDGSTSLENISSQSSIEDERKCYLALLLDAYKLFQQNQRLGISENIIYDGREPHKKLLVQAFEKYAPLTDIATDMLASVLYLSFRESDFDVKLQKAVKFCQQHLALVSKSSHITSANTSYNSSPSAGSKSNAKSLVKKGFGDTINTSKASAATAHPKASANDASHIDRLPNLPVIQSPQSSKQDAPMIVNQSTSSIHSNFSRAEHKSPNKEKATVAQSRVGGVTIVNVGNQSYTKITPSTKHPILSPSPGSAFTSMKHQERPPNPGPKIHHSKPPLLRSISMPVSGDATSSSLSSGEKNHQEGNIKKPTLQRTSSISDYTKHKLKTSILMRTSASLVRKPSITAQEILDIQADGESSQSEDEDDLQDDVVIEEGQEMFKPVSTNPCEAQSVIVISSDDNIQDKSMDVDPS